MKKTFYLLFLLLFTSGCSSQVGFENYRNNPFQFPYPEYFLKANILTVVPDDLQSEDIVVDTFHTIFSIDKKLADQVVKENNIFIVKRRGKKLFVVINENEKLMGCNEKVRELEKDFCTSFSSTEEYLEKLFLLTPDDLSKEKYLAAGNRWIVHNKGFLFKDVDKITIYQSNNYKAFRTDFKPSNSQIIVDLRIFHKKNPQKFQIFVFANKNEIVIRQILETIH